MRIDGLFLGFDSDRDLLDIDELQYTCEMMAGIFCFDSDTAFVLRTLHGEY